MIIEPRARGPVCLTVHPEGCTEYVQRQIGYVQEKGPLTVNAPRRVLVIGASTGFGLSTRIASAFGGRAETVGVFYERPATGTRTASPGWYNSAAFEEAARAEGLGAWSLNGDAFSDRVKREAVQLVRRKMGRLDLVVYSVAAPRRQHPLTGRIHTSVLKPLGRPYTGKTVNLQSGEVHELTLEPATEADVRETVAVMGGEDWRMWVDALAEADLLAPGAVTLAYSYIGPRLTRPIYRDGTIGKAKEDLEATAREMDPGVQEEVRRLWERADSANVLELSDLAFFREELNRICGFGFPGVDYAADVDPRVPIPSL